MVKVDQKFWFAALLLLYGAKPNVTVPTNANPDLHSLVEEFKKKERDPVEIIQDYLDDESQESLECFGWILEHYEKVQNGNNISHHISEIDGSTRRMLSAASYKED